MSTKASANAILRTPWPCDEIQRIVDSCCPDAAEAREQVQEYLLRKRAEPFGIVDPRHMLHGDGGRRT